MEENLRLCVQCLLTPKLPVDGSGVSLYITELVPLSPDHTSLGKMIQCPDEA